MSRVSCQIKQMVEGQEKSRFPLQYSSLEDKIGICSNSGLVDWVLSPYRELLVRLGDVSFLTKSLTSVTPRDYLYKRNESLRLCMIRTPKCRRTIEASYHYRTLCKCVFFFSFFSLFLNIWFSCWLWFIIVECLSYWAFMWGQMRLTLHVSYSKS